jgi:hypothetical protein
MYVRQRSLPRARCSLKRPNEVENILEGMPVMSRVRWLDLALIQVLGALWHAVAVINVASGLCRTFAITDPYCLKPFAGLFGECASLPLVVSRTGLWFQMTQARTTAAPVQLHSCEECNEWGIHQPDDELVPLVSNEADWSEDQFLEAAGVLAAEEFDVCLHFPAIIGCQNSLASLI